MRIYSYIRINIITSNFDNQNRMKYHFNHFNLIILELFDYTVSCLHLNCLSMNVKSENIVFTGNEV